MGPWASRPEARSLQLHRRRKSTRLFRPSPRRLSKPKTLEGTLPLPLRLRDSSRKPTERRNGLVPVRGLRREPEEAQARRPLPLMLRLQGR